LRRFWCHPRSGAIAAIISQKTVPFLREDYSTSGGYTGMRMSFYDSGRDI
jgi:hypothetical protein